MDLIPIHHAPGRFAHAVRHWFVRHRSLHAFVSGLALVLVWVAIWTASEHFIPHPLARIVVTGALGAVVLWLTGSFTNLFGDPKTADRLRAEDEQHHRTEKEMEQRIKQLAGEIKAEKRELEVIEKRMEGPPGHP